MIVLDASVLIAYLDGADTQHGRAEALLLREADEDLAASVLTLAEVLVGPVRAGRAEEVTEALRDLPIAQLAISSDAAERLAQLRATSGLRMPDCCVILAAQANGARLATFDGQLGRASAALGLPTLDE